LAKTISIVQEKKEKYQKAKSKIEELSEKLQKSEQKNKELFSKLTKEGNIIKQLKSSHKERIKELETENIRLKGMNKSFKT
jgi:uncharacterized protein YaaN involved in tellurite resistance